MNRCRICDAPTAPFLSFGKMPRGNGFLRPEQFAQEYFFPLEAAFCPTCTMVHLTEQPEPDRMFNDRYPFFTGSSRRMASHFRGLAEQALTGLNRLSDPFVVEIGCNDGTLLENLAGAGIRHLGVEPSSNVARAALGRGVRILCDFFDERLARRIVQEDGPADLIVAANVLCHIQDIHSVIEGIRILLKPQGALLFEDPYLGDVLLQTSYDQFYDEHVFLFSASSVRHLFRLHGMEVVNVQPQPTHGGSMRYTVAHPGTHPISGSVGLLLQNEKRLEFHRPETYDKFRQRCEASRDQLRALLEDACKQGRRVVGYGATSKSTTVINYCKITPRMIEFISDTTPLKQGTFSPGMHIPVRPYEEFLKNPPDDALLFAWNHREEILEKEKRFQEQGGRWILYVPNVTALS